jgi:hypothetical protein
MLVSNLLPPISYLLFIRMTPMSRRVLVIALFLVPAALQAPGAFAGDKPAARLRSPVGTVLERGSAGGWLSPMLYDAIPAGVPLVTLPGARGMLDVQEGDVRLVLAGNLPEFSATPVVESAVTLHQPAGGRNLEFTLERGRVLIENHKESGAVKVRVRVQGKSLDFDLEDKRTVVALELFSRWPAGSPFLKKPSAEHKPVGELIFLVVQGRSAIELNNERQPLQGPAMFRFNTLRGVEGPLALKKAPAWVDPGQVQTDQGKELHKAVEKLRRAIADKGVAPALAQAQSSAEAPLRAVAAYSGSAVGDLAAGIRALKEDKAKTVRAAGIDALVHYIGRGSTEDLRLYESLLAGKTKAGQAGIIMDLLHGMSAEARLRPETYDALITYLQSDHLAIRELAAMNLYGLVPEGRGIAYDAAGPQEQRARAQAAWRKLIPAGQVPKMAN